MPVTPLSTAFTEAADIEAATPIRVTGHPWIELVVHPYLPKYSYCPIPGQAGFYVSQDVYDRMREMYGEITVRKSEPTP